MPYFSRPALKFPTIIGLFAGKTRLKENHDKGVGFSMDRQAAWNKFIHTGRVEDYLQYIRAQNFAGAGHEEEPPSDADIHQWDRDSYQQYR